LTEAEEAKNTSNQEHARVEPTGSVDHERKEIERSQAPELRGDESIDPLLVELLDEADASPAKRSLIIEAIARTHTGPLPDGATLAEYKAVDPRLLDEVIEGARDNRLHRYQMDKELANTARLSLIFVAILTLIAIAAAVVFAVLDYPWVAALFGAGGLATIVLGMLKGGGEWRGRGRSAATGSE
jgi:uncharacterized membrane protein